MALGAWDARRFRSNVLLGAVGQPVGSIAAPEDDVVGQRVCLGDALLDIRERIDRCVMVTRPQPGLALDRDVLRTLHRERGGCLAGGALVEAAGEVEEGDELRLR